MNAPPLTQAQAEGLVIKSEPYQMRVPRSQRGGEIVEPLVREQWFVRMEPLAIPALEVRPIWGRDVFQFRSSNSYWDAGCLHMLLHLAILRTNNPNVQPSQPSLAPTKSTVAAPWAAGGVQRRHPHPA